MSCIAILDGQLIGDSLGCYPASATDYGPGDIGKAMTICSNHEAYSAGIIMVPAPSIPNFRPGWEACAKVWSAWQDSETAKRQREAEEEAERQRQFVNEVAKALK